MSGSWALSFCFVGLVFCTVGVALWGLYRTTNTRATARATFVIIVWMAATAFLASTGRLMDWSRPPPPIVLLSVVGGLAAMAFVFSPFGTRFADQVDFAALVGFQAIRLPLALLLQPEFFDGSPSFLIAVAGYNIDSVIGIFAIGLVALRRKHPVGDRTVVLFNLVGFVALAANVRAGFQVAPRVLSHWPEVWLVTVLVPALFVGHLLLTRKLLRGSQAEVDAGDDGRRVW